MNTLIVELEKKNNYLEVEKVKLMHPKVHKIEDVEEEIWKLTEDIERLKQKAEKVTEIDSIKKLMFSQINEYILKIDKETIYPFSKSQGLKFNHMFYISPLIDIKNILFRNLKGVSGAILNLTLNEDDRVENKNDFLILLKEIQQKINNSKNLYDLYNTIQYFSDKIKKDFC